MDSEYVPPSTDDDDSTSFHSSINFDSNKEYEELKTIPMNNSNKNVLEEHNISGIGLHANKIDKPIYQEKEFNTEHDYFIQQDENLEPTSMASIETREISNSSKLRICPKKGKKRKHKVLIVMLLLLILHDTWKDNTVMKWKYIHF